MSSANTRPTILAINGSERPRGNTSLVLDHCADYLAPRGVDLTSIRLWDLDMTACGPCGDCNFRSQPCEVQDDVKSAVDAMAQADGIIYATSVHGFGTSPRMPAFLERSGTGYLRFNRVLTNKVGGAIVIGRRYSHTETYGFLQHHMMLNRMIVPGYGFPATLFGDHAGEALQDEEGVEMLHRMLDRMSDLIVVLREHRELTGRDGLAVAIPGERHRGPASAA